MNYSGNGDFSWRLFPESGVRIENPRLLQPVTLIVDDPTPGYNPASFHSGFRFGPLKAPRELVDDVADLIEATGIRGKFSVIPYPFGLGRVDRGVEGVTDADRRYFLDVVRERIAPFLDITPEALTHWNALDLATGQLLPLWEHLWSRTQDRTTLTPYLSLALEIVNGANLPSTGITSPWDFGDGVEEEYAEAILAAQQRVNGRSFTWYFLQMDSASRHVAPRVPILRPEAGEVVVSIVTCDSYDFGRACWAGGEPDPDMLITEDGQGGRLAAVLSAGGPGVFHTHWQTFFSQGSRSGLRGLGVVAQRIADNFGDRVAWTRCEDLAHYTAAAAAVALTLDVVSDTEQLLATSTPFSASQFTISIPVTRQVRSVRLNAGEWSRVATPGQLQEDCYFEAQGRLYLCWKLEGQQQIAISFN